ncbi:MAG: alanine--glyoxylate aminotransferase family protein [Planctomycetes bacterium]|nr:alanine--glyoxylate aminotransferase family protein [Planctomycetota bacterium]
MSEPAADHPILFLPGPTEVDAELRRIMAMPLIGHRNPRFVDAAKDVCARLRELFLTAQHAAFETCTGTALMEAAIRNLVPRAGRTLHLVGGAFGVRFVEVARGCGRAPEAIEVPLGSAHDPAALDAHLTAGPAPDAVCITHNETSTGALQPLAALAATVRRRAPDALLLVDVVTSLAGAELRFDDWGLDFAFAGTQKCLALPPGLGVYAVSERALQRAASIDERGFLLDLITAVPDTEAGKPIATPCVPLVFALQRQLERIAEEGLRARWSRHLALRDRTLQWCTARGMTPFVQDVAARSPTVSCVDALGQDVEALARRAAAAGFQLDKGYGTLRGKAFRVGHMGDHDLARLERLLAAL